MPVWDCRVCCCLLQPTTFTVGCNKRYSLVTSVCFHRLSIPTPSSWLGIETTQIPIMPGNEVEKAVTARRETMQEQEALATKLEIVTIVLVDKSAEVGDHIIVVGKIESSLNVVPQVAYAEPESLKE